MPEEYLGGADNVRALDAAPIVSVEAVSLPSEFVLKGWKDNHPVIEEHRIIGWRGGPLKVEAGPVPVPSSLGLRIKCLLHEPIMVQPLPWCGNVPSHRINLKEENHVLQIIVIPCYAGFEVYRDGKHVGGRTTGQYSKEAWAIIGALDALFEGNHNLPNKAAEPSRTAPRSP